MNLVDFVSVCDPVSTTKYDEILILSRNRSAGGLLGASRRRGPCRHERFSEVKNLIISNNANPNSSIAMRFYPESLYGQGEFARRRLGFIRQNFDGKYYVPKKTAKRGTDEYLNYVDLGYVTPVKVNWSSMEIREIIRIFLPP